MQRSHPRSGPLQLVTVAVTAALLLTACSGGGSSSDPDPSEGGDSSEVDAAGDTGGESSTLVVGVPAVTSTMDPTDYAGIPHSYAAFWVQPHLVNFATIGPDEPIPAPVDTIPWLAESVEIEDDGVTVVLRDDAVSPAGNTVSSEDAQWTLERAIATEGRVATFYLTTAGVDFENPVEIIDDRTYRINADTTPLTMFALARHELAPLDSQTILEHATDDDPWASEWLTSNSASYGPYEVVSLAPEEELRLVANPNWWGASEFTRFDEIVVRQVPDSTTRAQLLASGDIDLAFGVPFEVAAEYEGQDGLTILTQASTGILTLELNKQFEPFTDPNVRRAMSMAINRDDIASGPYQGFAPPATSVVSSLVPGVEGSGPYYDYDVETATDLMADSDYPDGFEMTITIEESQVAEVSLESVGILLRSQLQPLGITVNLERVASAADFSQERGDGQYQAWLQGETPLASDAAYLFNLHHTNDATSNYMNDTLDEITPLVEEAVDTTVEDGRNDLMQEAIDLYDEAVYNVPLIESRSLVMSGPDVCSYPLSGRMAIELPRTEPCA